MATFNSSLKAGSVVVAVDHKYNDNDGAYSIAYVWDGEQVVPHTYADGYNKVSYTAAVKDATKEQVDAAAEWYVNVRKDTSVRGTRATFIGCTVSLQRSRKAPNGVPVQVLDYVAGGYNRQYNRRDPEQIKVKAGECTYWVSTGCVKEVIKGDSPWWANK